MNMILLRTSHFYYLSLVSDDKPETEVCSFSILISSLYYIIISDYIQYLRIKYKKHATHRPWLDLCDKDGPGNEPGLVAAGYSIHQCFYQALDCNI